MFHTKVRGGKAFTAGQKVREFKKILLRSKRLEKQRGKRIKPNDLIRKAAQNINEKISTYKRKNFYKVSAGTRNY